MTQLQSGHQWQLTAEQQDLPFACFQQPPEQQQHQPPEQHHQPPEPQQQPTEQQQQYSLGGVCILRQKQDADQANSSIDVGVLQHAGFKIRPSCSCIPDMIITAKALPAPLAVLVVQASPQSPGSSMDSPDFLQSFSGKVMLLYYSPQEGAAACILQLANSLAMASDEQAAIADQHLVAATSKEALQTCLAGLAACDPALPTAEQLQELLALGYGSLHQLAVAATAQDMAACMGCTEEQGQRLWWLLNSCEALTCMRDDHLLCIKCDVHHP